MIGEEKWQEHEKASSCSSPFESWLVEKNLNLSRDLMVLVVVKVCLIVILIRTSKRDGSFVFLQYNYIFEMKSQFYEKFYSEQRLVPYTQN